MQAVYAKTNNRINHLRTMRKSIPFIAAGCLVAQTAVAQKQPHIILIMTDQQRADAIGCCGNENIITPHLDSLCWNYGREISTLRACRRIVNYT